MYWPKAALIALYFKIIPSTMPRLRTSLYVVTGFVVACAITTCLLDTLWCAPNIASNWSLEEGACSAFNSLLVLQIDWAMNCFSDVASKDTRKHFKTFMPGIANLHWTSLRPSLPSFAPSSPQPQPDIRTFVNLYAWTRYHRRQPRSFHHNPDWQQLERRVHMVHGRDGRRNHRCLSPCAEDSTTSQKQDFNHIKVISRRTTLYGYRIAGKVCVCKR